LKYITNKEAKKFNLYEKAAGEISKYTNEPMDIVKQKHKLGPVTEKDYGIFRNQQGLTNLSVEDFYKKCNYYLYELPLWNAERNRPRYLYLISSSYLKRNRYRKVLDFGAGAGDLCIELAKNNLDVTYCDIGEQLYNFAKWRFQKRNLQIKMAKGIDNLGNGVYDCMFSFDTFEHSKDLPGILKKLVQYIKPGGSLIFSGAFSGGTLHLEENEKYNNFKNLNLFMNDCKLAFQDKFAQFYFYKKMVNEQ
jgi:2-polyprenyl-3-methyl-5-hydroxy-6-metoxy-1,4-benzoquinol methylase